MAGSNECGKEDESGSLYVAIYQLQRRANLALHVLGRDEDLAQPRITAHDYEQQRPPFHLQEHKTRMRLWL